MKSKLALTLILIAALTGCTHRAAIEKTATEATTKATAATVHKDGTPVYFCNAPTKAGGHCKNRVAKEGDHCFMHKAAK